MWFTNFTGQIFYIDHETMTLAEGYNYKNESNYPRMALLNDELLATSDKGLFVLDTKTLKGKYLKVSNYTTSLAALNNQVLIHGSNNSWYSYKETTGLKRLTYTEPGEIAGNSYVLANSSYRDTAYLMSNPSGIIKKLVVRNDTLKLCRQLQFNSHINTLSITQGDQWVNTNDCSYSLKTGEQIKGYNLTDIATDFEGNRWLSSLYHGLLMAPKKILPVKQ